MPLSFSAYDKILKRPCRNIEIEIKELNESIINEYAFGLELCVCHNFNIIIFICVSDSFNPCTAKNKGGLSEDIHAMNMMMAVLNMRG